MQAGGRTPLVQQSGTERVFVLPPGRLQRGGKYEWTVMTSRGRYRSGFDVLSAGDAAEVERDLDEKGITGTGATREQKLDELMVLFDHGLDYEAKLLAIDLDLGPKRSRKAPGNGAATSRPPGTPRTSTTR